MPNCVTCSLCCSTFEVINFGTEEFSRGYSIAIDLTDLFWDVQMLDILQPLFWKFHFIQVQLVCIVCPCHSATVDWTRIGLFHVLIGFSPQCAQRRALHKGLLYAQGTAAFRDSVSGSLNERSEKSVEFGAIQAWRDSAQRQWVETVKHQSHEKAEGISGGHEKQTRKGKE